MDSALSTVCSAGHINAAVILVERCISGNIEKGGATPRKSASNIIGIGTESPILNNVFYMLNKRINFRPAILELAW
jgi:hypothetical protein